MLRGYGLYILRLRLRSMKLGILCLVTTASVLTLTVWIRKDVWTNVRSLKLSVGWSNFTGVILLTYMRSGSSLTGDILQQNSNVFYVYEPLRILRDLIKHKKPIQWLNGTVSTIATLNTTDVKRQSLIGWLCPVLIGEHHGKIIQTTSIQISKLNTNIYTKSINMTRIKQVQLSFKDKKSENITSRY
ncbi:uncharacterized protein LOC123529901 [Mercenaria mercenaria]|uniref:uncharacterized protein LOC123529901 n=1 Tax=Mercenaria mercenaria TaxID=6596 RepID=UPI00234E9321|nr:uncharacterized protein LOC123529901 [Mercenaria mercenaria]